MYCHIDIFWRFEINKDEADQSIWFHSENVQVSVSNKKEDLVISPKRLIDPRWEVGGKENVYHFLRSGPGTQSPDMGQEMHWWLFDLPDYMPIAA